MEPDQDWLQNLDTAGLHAIDRQLGRRKSSIGVGGGPGPLLIEVGLPLDDDQQLAHLLARLVFREVSEARERRLWTDLLTDARDEPLIEKERAAGDRVAAHADFCLPER